MDSAIVYHLDVGNGKLDNLPDSISLEENYPFIVNDVMKYIEKIKSGGDESSLIEIIMDYCIKNDTPVELVGDAISNDVYFKSFIEKDCELHKIFKTENNSIDEW